MYFILARSGKIAWKEGSLGPFFMENNQIFIYFLAHNFLICTGYKQTKKQENLFGGKC